MEDTEDIWEHFTPSSEKISTRLESLRKRYEMPYELEEEEEEKMNDDDDDETAFYLRLQELESIAREENEDSNTEYEKRMVKFEKSCNKLLSEIGGSLSCLKHIENDHGMMQNKAGSLHKRCQKLLREQTQLQNVLKKIEKPLKYYEELERLAPLFGVPDAIPEAARRRVESRESKITRLQDLEMDDDDDVDDEKTRVLVPGSQSFSLELERVEECIRFMEHHPRYRGRSEYLGKFRIVRSHALKLARIKVETSLREATKDIMNDLKKKKVAETTMLYVKIRALGRSLRPIIVDVERRVDEKEFATLLMDFHRCFCEHRLKLLLPIAKERLAIIGKESEDNIGRFARDSFEFLQTCCEDEQDLFHEFFTPSAIQPIDSDKASNLMGKMMRDLCDGLYAELRPRVIQQVDIDVLCDLVQIFSDIQSRVLSSSATTITNEEKNKSRRTLSNISESGDSVTVFCSLVQRMIADTQEKLVYRFEKHLDKKIRSFRPSKSDLEGYPERLLQGKEHEATYPTLQETLSCLSKMYTSTNRNVFQIIAQSSLTACMQSLREASNMISDSSSDLDGTLFLISQLLILTENISRFDVDLIITEKSTSVGKLLGDLVSTIGGFSNSSGSSSSSNFMGRLFSLQNNPLLGAVRANIKVETVDSKQRLAEELSMTCRHFVEQSMLYVARSLVLLTVELENEKVNSSNSDKKEKKKRQKIEDTAKLFKAVMNEDLEMLRNAMRDYDNKLLLSVRNKADQTLVELAKLRRKQKSLQVLTQEPYTMLFKAVMKEDLDILEIAMVKYDHQILRSLRNKAGETLCELAESRNKTRVLNVLKRLEDKKRCNNHDDARRKKHVTELSETCEGVSERVQSLRNKIRAYSCRNDVKALASLQDPIFKKTLQACNVVESALCEEAGYVKDELLSIRKSLSLIRDAIRNSTKKTSSSSGYEPVSL